MRCVPILANVLSEASKERRFGHLGPYFRRLLIQIPSNKTWCVKQTIDFINEKKERTLDDKV